MTDIHETQDQRDRLAAVERYLKNKQAHLPALGAQRRLEARIGQLLGITEQGKRNDLKPVGHEQQVVDGRERHDFRVLARALNGDCELSKDEWRKSRRQLVAIGG